MTEPTCRHNYRVASQKCPYCLDAALIREAFLRRVEILRDAYTQGGMHADAATVEKVRQSLSTVRLEDVR